MNDRSNCTQHHDGSLYGKMLPSADDNDTCIESIVREALATVDAQHADDTVPTPAMSYPAPRLLPLPTFPVPHTSNSQNTHRSRPQEPFVTMSDIFALLRTAEAESRLCPAKASRLRQVLMEGNGTYQSPGCWMNVVFRVLCELIPGPVYPSAGSVRLVPAVDVHPPVPPVLSALQTSYSAQGPLNDTLKRIPDESSVGPGASIPAINAPTLPDQSMQTSNETACQPCSQTDTKPTAIERSPLENDDAVTTLLNMKMAQDSPNTSNNNIQPPQKRKASSNPSPNKGIPSSATIYPHPFPVKTFKDPTLYRRTRCKNPSCPNMGSPCPHHGHDIKICKVSCCTNRAVQGGVCSKHGAKRPLCRVEGCTNQAKREGRCIKHGAVLGGCSMEGCGNQARSGGFCRKHGAK